MDSTALLTADHNRVRGLFTRFKEAREADDARTTAGLAEETFTELQVHTTIEEDVFYPDVRRGDDELEDMVADGLEEHHVVDVLMAEAEARRLEAGKAQLGAPTMADKEHLSVDDLRHLAQDQEIPGRSSMDREELLATVAPG